MKSTVDAWGRVVYDPSNAFELLYKGVDIKDLEFSKLNEELENYNKLCLRFNKAQDVVRATKPLDHTPEEEHKKRSEHWFYDGHHANIDVRKHCLALCKTENEKNRVNLEMDMFEERNMLPILRSMIWLIDYFRTNNIVWGVGRGSSVASYCLFLIGVHKIDSLKYNLDISEFLR